MPVDNPVEKLIGHTFNPLVVQLDRSILITLENRLSSWDLSGKRIQLSRKQTSPILDGNAPCVPMNQRLSKIRGTHFYATHYRAQVFEHDTVAQ